MPSSPRFGNSEPPAEGFPAWLPPRASGEHRVLLVSVRAYLLRLFVHGEVWRGFSVEEGLPEDVELAGVTMSPPERDQVAFVLRHPLFSEDDPYLLDVMHSALSA